MKQLILLVREYIAQQLLLLAIRVAPKRFAIEIGKAVLKIDKDYVLGDE